MSTAGQGVCQRCSKTAGPRQATVPRAGEEALITLHPSQIWWRLRTPGLCSVPWSGITSTEPSLVSAIAVHVPSGAQSSFQPVHECSVTSALLQRTHTESLRAGQDERGAAHRLSREAGLGAGLKGRIFCTFQSSPPSISLLLQRGSTVGGVQTGPTFFLDFNTVFL